MIGRTISHYKILEKLGEGGMGVVYKARDTNLDRDVALKFLPDDFVNSAEDVLRLEQEAKALSVLNHQNIATIHDVTEVDGKKYIVMEFIPGGTLRGLLKERTAEGKELSLDEILVFGIQIAEGLASAHDAGIIHRDVKTENMMLSARGTVKITDFGLAKLRGGDNLTKTGSTPGTAAYMSPEQLRGLEVDTRSDLFSLGVVLYELTTALLPFRGAHDAALAYAIVHETPEPLGMARTGVPPSLARVIDRCLEKDVSRRYQNADDVASDLKRIRAGSGEAAIRASQGAVKWWIAAGILGGLGLLWIFLFRGVQDTQTGTDNRSNQVVYYSEIIDEYWDTTAIDVRSTFATFSLKPLPDSVRGQIDVKVVRALRSYFYPATLVTKSDVGRDMIKKGRLPGRHYGGDRDFFRDELGCTSGVVVNLFVVSPPFEGDTIVVIVQYFVYRNEDDNSASYSAIGGHISHTSDPAEVASLVESDVAGSREYLGKRDATATVISVDKGRVILQFKPGRRYSPGMLFYATRMNGRRELERRLRGGIG